VSGIASDRKHTLSPRSNVLGLHLPQCSEGGGGGEGKVINAIVDRPKAAPLVDGRRGSFPWMIFPPLVKDEYAHASCSTKKKKYKKENIFIPQFMVYIKYFLLILICQISLLSFE
jgi:hypothetical protein